MEKQFNSRSLTVYLKARRMIHKANLSLEDFTPGGELESLLKSQIEELNKDIESFEEFFLEVFDIRVLFTHNGIPYRVIDEQINLILC